MAASVRPRRHGGAGGVTIELLGDVAFALAPVGPVEARSMIESLRGYPMLNGYRGATPLDVDALADAVSARVACSSRHGTAAEGDGRNPIRVLPEGSGVVALDALATLAE